MKLIRSERPGSPALRRDHHLQLRIARRAAGIWFVIRTTSAFFNTLAGLPPLTLSVRGGVILTAVVWALSRLEFRRRNEDLLLANLGVAPARLHLGVTLVPLLLEAALRTLISL